MDTIIRRALARDLDQIVQLRMRLFDDAVDLNGCRPDAEMLQVTRDYFQQAFDSDDCATWVADRAGRVVALGSLVVFARPPYPGNAAGKEAYLLNMYTLPEQRRQGLAQAILREAMAHAGEKGYAKVWLHATEDGQSLYLSAGFSASDKYMEWQPA
ncbi:GNAT family N-acetyltransferase [Chromobacterium sphagni]|uniref:N-acetyltransferase domain-containing protein n=1 Tax=Chromobacterium sphagni TaxID=1903179 RepID=A0A1S1X495_9NEIS|nr:GNAT family N-acetyltransferase [Chromobacterium sphagni]OHX14302.1 hypothetical protein BI347_12900 [Chromobacterium sphagni]OHX16297.1 hypothetical protein BI344_12815 [Chromobacterium sphagni]